MKYTEQPSLSITERSRLFQHTTNLWGRVKPLHATTRQQTSLELRNLQEISRRYLETFKTSTVGAEMQNMHTAPPPTDNQGKTGAFQAATNVPFTQPQKYANSHVKSQLKLPQRVKYTMFSLEDYPRRCDRSCAQRTKALRVLCNSCKRASINSCNSAILFLHL